MDFKETEIFGADETSRDCNDPIRDLSDLQLALIGGGIADIVGA